MTMSAKQIRTSAKQRFTRKYNTLSTRLQEKADILEINLAFEDLTESWKRVEEKNDEYLSSVEEIDVESVEEWITELQQKYVTIRAAVCSRQREAANVCRKEAAKRTFKSNEFNLSRQFTSIETLMAGDCTQQTLNKEINILDGFFVQFTQTYAECLESTCDLGTDSELETLMSRGSTRYSQIKLDVDRYLDSKRNSSKTSFRMEKPPCQNLMGIFVVMLSSNAISQR